MLVCIFLEIEIHFSSAFQLVIPKIFSLFCGFEVGFMVSLSLDVLMFSRCMPDVMEKWNLLMVFYGYATYAAQGLLSFLHLAASVLL